MSVIADLEHEYDPNIVIPTPIGLRYPEMRVINVSVLVVLFMWHWHIERYQFVTVLSTNIEDTIIKTFLILI